MHGIVSCMDVYLSVFLMGSICFVVRIDFNVGLFCFVKFVHFQCVFLWCKCLCVCNHKHCHVKYPFPIVLCFFVFIQCLMVFLLIFHLVLLLMLVI
jgi:hypothetical protein